MKPILTYLCLLLTSFSFSQAQLTWLNMHPSDEFTYEPNVNFHSSIRPWVGRSTSSDLYANDSTEVTTPFRPYALADVAAFTPNWQLRTMAGAGVEYQPSNKLYARFSGLGGLEKTGGFHSSHSSISTDGPNDLTQKIDLRGALSYSPNKLVNLQVGYDELFFGEGSRSLMLGDYGLPYAYGQARLNFWRFEYVALYQFFNERNTQNQRFNKYGASHYLSTNITKWLNIGIFETVIFNPKDTLLNRGYEFEYLNPMIFYRPQEYALGSVDNVLLGLNGSIKIKQFATLYGQLMLDEFSLTEIRARSRWWANKFAIQAGAKALIPLNNGNQLFARAEVNVVRPYTYAHLSNAQSYSHANHVLAHPYGANFAEILTHASYTHERWRLDSYFNYSLRGLSNDSINYGENIYVSYLNRDGDYGHTIGQGDRNYGVRHQLRIAYMAIPDFQMEVFVEVHNRWTSLNTEPKFQAVFGIRNRLWNDYRNY